MASRRERRPRQAGVAVKRILTGLGDTAPVKLAAEKDIADKISAARARLVLDEQKPNPVAALGAAAFAATAAVLMAGVVVAGPGVHFEDPATILTP